MSKGQGTQNQNPNDLVEQVFADLERVLMEADSKKVFSIAKRMETLMYRVAARFSKKVDKEIQAGSAVSVPPKHNGPVH